jgi:hypothetical protein
MAATHGKLTLTEGVISARIEPLAMIDAAVSGELAGVEVDITDAVVYVGPRTDYRSDLTLSLSMRPHTMATLRDRLATTLPGPAFTDGEWRSMLDCLREYAALPDSEDNCSIAANLADRIEEGLNAR